MSTWSIQDSASLYGIPSWGRDFVSVSQDGHLLVGPEGRGLAPVDRKHLVDDMQRRGIDLPILIRFPDVLAARVDGLATAFQNAIHDQGYTGMYRGCTPSR